MAATLTLRREARCAPPAWAQAAAVLVLACLLPACERSQPQAVTVSDPPQDVPAMTASPSPLRAAYEALAALPDDETAKELRASAALSRLQGQVRTADAALAEPLAALAAHERPVVRATAIALIGQLAAEDGGALPPAAHDALLQGMADGDEQVRLEAMRAAAPLRDDEVRDARIAALSDTSALVRFQALRTLDAAGQLDAEPARGRALALREDPDRLVRELALTLVGSD